MSKSVSVPAELVEALRDALRHRFVDMQAAARALVDAVERPTATEPLCTCGHTQERHGFGHGYCGRCSCVRFAPPSLPDRDETPRPSISDEAEAPDAFEDELDAHIAESMKDPEYAAADARRREAEASWRDWVPSMFADDENMHTAYVSGYLDRATKENNHG